MYRIHMIKTVLLISMIFFVTGRLQAENLKVVKYQGEFPPYFFQKGGKEVGGFIEIFRRLEQLTGIEFQFMTMPMSRALHFFDHGRVDIEPNVNPAWRKDVKEPGLFTIPYDQSVEIILFSKGNRIPVQKPMDLSGRHVGVVFGYRYPGFDELFKQNLIFQHNFTNEEKLLKILSGGGGIKQIFINKYAALFWMKTIPAYRSFELGDDISRLDVMLRLHPSKKKFLPVLNRALKSMKDNREIQKIYARYR